MEVFVARQPIFNRQQKVYGYELLYRLGMDNFYNNPAGDGDRATSEVIANSFLLIGLDALTGGKRAFINFTENLLKNEVATILPKEVVAIEILENIEVDDKVVNACIKLKKLGYPLVLDDFVLDERFKPLVELADIIKIDFMECDIREKMDVIRRFGSEGVQLLAEKVETTEMFKEAFEMGYSYFQGYFFSRPIILTGQDIPGYKINYLQALEEVNRPEMDFDRLEGIIKRDVSLSYKLLKYINSAAFGFRSKIDSIKHALVLLGIQEIKNWVSLIILRGMGEDKPDEITTSSILRAKFGELIAPKVGLQERSSDLFLMGMFSMIDALISRPMTDILDELPIAEDIKRALLGKECHYRDLYELILAYEKGNWEEFSALAARIKLDEAEVPKIYLQSLAWANQVMQL
ncbi:MAG: EAL and HDOD domain-containing protein [Eubacteriales bacterium]